MTPPSSSSRPRSGRGASHKFRLGNTSKRHSSSPRDTSWQGVKTWYNKLVGTDGHYYHQHVVLPGVLRLLDLKSTDSLVDLGCGQGILARSIPEVSEYLGIDLSSSLVAEARAAAARALPTTYAFQTADAAKPLASAQPHFTHAAIILALQNMRDAQTALTNAAHFLLPNGKLIIVLNHPCFRIPRQSGWGTDEKTKQQYRWINRYLSPLKIPITMHPGKQAQAEKQAQISNENQPYSQLQATNSQLDHAKKPERSESTAPRGFQPSAVTWSFHHSLQDYSHMLSQAGFVITTIEEWTSDKESAGKAAKMENRSRSEFPLFMALVCKKV